MINTHFERNDRFSMHKITELAAARLAESDLLIILAEPDGLPASVIVHWPSHPTAIDPAAFRDAADTMVKLFSEAHVTLAGIKARRL
jgi:hypothetical protein